MSCITSLLWWDKPLDVQSFPLRRARAWLIQTTGQVCSFLWSHYFVGSTYVDTSAGSVIGKRYLHAQSIIKFLLMSILYAILALMTAISGGIPCLAWNYPFPTKVEICMWRTLVLVMGWLLVLSFFCFVHACFVIAPIARLGLVALSFSSLRSLDPGVFCAVSWTTYIPHIN